MCFLRFRYSGLNALHRSANTKISLRKRDLVPCQRTQLSDSDTGEQTQEDAEIQTIGVAY